jgi:hypothetical protein
VGIGISILLIAAGAVLTWAVSFHVSSVSIHLVGIILMVVGGLGLLAALIIGGSSRTPVRES